MTRSTVEQDVLEEKRKKKRKKAGTESSKESSLRDWFGRKGAKGKKKGWVDCNAPDGKGGYKSCGRSSGEKRKKYPACRPTPGACKERGKGKSWGKKAKKKKKNESMEYGQMELTLEQLEKMINEEVNLVLEELEVLEEKRKRSLARKLRENATLKESMVGVDLLAKQERQRVEAIEYAQGPRKVMPTVLDLLK